jgi:hypothetical protein
MSYRIAGIDVHKKMLAVVVSNVVASRDSDIIKPSESLRIDSAV